MNENSISIWFVFKIKGEWTVDSDHPYQSNVRFKQQVQWNEQFDLIQIAPQLCTERVLLSGNIFTQNDCMWRKIPRLFMINFPNCYFSFPLLPISQCTTYLRSTTPRAPSPLPLPHIPSTYPPPCSSCCNAIPAVVKFQHHFLIQRW